MAALAAVPVALALAVPASADADPAPPFIDHATWVSYGGLASLRVYPTKAGRAASTELGQPPWDADEAWAEVLAAAPDADTAGMLLTSWGIKNYDGPLGTNRLLVAAYTAAGGTLSEA